MDIPYIEEKLKVLKRYQALGEKLMPLIEQEEKIPGVRAAVQRSMELLVEEIDALTERKKLIEKYPEISGMIPKKTPEQQRRLTQSQILLYDTYIALGIPEEEAIRRSLDPSIAMFQRFDSLASIYGIG